MPEWFPRPCVYFFFVLLVCMGLNALNHIGIPLCDVQRFPCHWFCAVRIESRIYFDVFFLLSLMCVVAVHFAVHVSSRPAA